MQPLPQTSAQLAPWQAGRVLSFIEDNLAAPLLIRDVARVARLSSSYFSSTFKSTFGRSVKGFIIARRLARAQGLMLASDDTLAQIALSVGFADQAHFSRCFRNNIGESPHRWRQRRREDRASLPLLVA